MADVEACSAAQRLRSRLSELSERAPAEETARGACASAVAALVGEGCQAGTVRLAALAWLVASGLRRTACCMDASAVTAVRAALGGQVDFDVRGEHELSADRFWLSDLVVLYAAGAREELAPVWAEHRAAYTRGADLGRALGYYLPAERRADTDTAPRIHLHHTVTVRGLAPVGLWAEHFPAAPNGVPPSPCHPSLHEYLRGIGLALQGIGLAYSFELKNEPR